MADSVIEKSKGKFAKLPISEQIEVAKAWSRRAEALNFMDDREAGLQSRIKAYKIVNEILKVDPKNEEALLLDASLTSSIAYQCTLRKLTKPKFDKLEDFARAESKFKTLLNQTSTETLKIRAITDFAHGLGQWGFCLLLKSDYGLKNPDVFKDALSKYLAAENLCKDGQQQTNSKDSRLLATRVANLRDLAAAQAKAIHVDFANSRKYVVTAAQSNDDVPRKTFDDAFLALGNLENWTAQRDRDRWIRTKANLTITREQNLHNPIVEAKTACTETVTSLDKLLERPTENANFECFLLKARAYETCGWIAYKVLSYDEAIKYYQQAIDTYDASQTEFPDIKIAIKFRAKDSHSLKFIARKKTEQKESH